MIFSLDFVDLLLLFIFSEDTAGAKKSIEKTWNEKYKRRNDLFWRYHLNKRLKELYKSELLKENPRIPRNFQIATVKKLKKKNK